MGKGVHISISLILLFAAGDDLVGEQVSEKSLKELIDFEGEFCEKEVWTLELENL